MKKLLFFTPLIVASLLAVPRVSAAAAPSRTVLSSSTKNGVTTTVYIGRVQGEPAEDGSLSLAVFPLVVKTDSEGLVLSSVLDTNATVFALKLTSAQLVNLSTLIKGAWDAARAATVTDPP
jgi:hypothetical protein